MYVKVLRQTHVSLHSLITPHNSMKQPRNNLDNFIPMSSSPMHKLAPYQGRSQRGARGGPAPPTKVLAPPTWPRAVYTKCLNTPK